MYKLFKSSANCHSQFCLSGERSRPTDSKRQGNNMANAVFICDVLHHLITKICMFRLPAHLNYAH